MEHLTCVGFLIIMIVVCSKATSVIQPDDVDRGGYDNVVESTEDSSLCTRKCVSGEHRICRYKFIIEPYTTLGPACGSCPNTLSDCFKPQCITGDGVERSLLSVNRRMPGPSIQVCRNDTVVIDVVNRWQGSGLTIHWHGIRQIKTPWYDGVPMVTQCPILEQQTFRYNFICDDYGTFFWHSHDGLQKVDGIVGSLIVREPDNENLLIDYYDHDLPSHLMLIQDWMHTLSQDRSPGGQTHNIGQTPDSYLINGMGVNADMLKTLDSSPKYPVATFKVTKDKRYRFRVIAGTCLACPVRITVGSHQLTMLTTDDSNIEPMSGVHAFDMVAGERYDFVLHADQPEGMYWILVKGLDHCDGISQVAILEYEGANSIPPSQEDFTLLKEMAPAFVYNKINLPCTSDSLSSGVCVSQLVNREQNPSVISGDPYKQFYLGFGFKKYEPADLFVAGTYHRYYSPATGFLAAAYINNISHIETSAPLLTQRVDVPPYQLCSPERCPDPAQLCECSHVIEVPHNQLIELIIWDDSTAKLSHPFHLHGHDFFIVEQGILGAGGIEEVRERFSRSERTVGTHLPSKDVVMVPASGYIVVRFYADNRGIWLMHCHFAYHQLVGMALLWQVGSTDDFLQPPPTFPKCHDYKPLILDAEYWAD